MMNTIGGATTIGPMTIEFGPSSLLEPPTPQRPQSQRASFAFPLCLLFGVFLAVYFPAHLIFPTHPPIVEVEADGYFLSYTAPPRPGQAASAPGRSATVQLYIARDNTGRCYAGTTPPGWDTDLCEARLQQIEAGTCKAVPALDDAQCRAMLPPTGMHDQLRRSHIIFTLKEGAPMQAREASQ